MIGRNGFGERFAKEQRGRNGSGRSFVPGFDQIFYRDHRTKRKTQTVHCRSCATTLMDKRTTRSANPKRRMRTWRPLSKYLFVITVIMSNRPVNMYNYCRVPKRTARKKSVMPIRAPMDDSDLELPENSPGNSITSINSISSLLKEKLSMVSILYYDFHVSRQ